MTSYIAEDKKIVTGVISPQGIGGFSTRQGGDHIVMNLRPWKIDDEIFHTELRLEMKIPADVYSARLEDFQSKLSIGQLISVSIQNIKSNHFGGHTSEMLSLISSNETNRPLQELYAELHKPLMEDSVIFGAMHFDRRLKTYNGEFVYRDYSISISCDSTSFTDDAIDRFGLERLESIAKNLEQKDMMARKFAATHLLGIKNDSWLENNECPLKLEDFEKRMKLTTLTFDRYSEVTFWYDDGKIFFGHTIAVTMNSENNFTEATFMG